MSPWQKIHIAAAINALYWDWFHVALNEIHLTMTAQSKIASDNKYDDKILNLSNDDLIEHIRKIRRYVTNINKK